MSDPSDVWQNSAPAANDNFAREASPRADRDEREPRERSPAPRRDRSRSPAARNGGGDGAGGRGRGDGPQVGNTGNNLHVSGLARSINDNQLEEIFSKCGKITKAQVMFDPHTQESRGFGFVMFETNEEAQNAVDTMSGTTIEGRVVTVAHAKRSRARTPTPGRYQGVKHDRAGQGFGGSRYGGGYEDRPYYPRSMRDDRYYDRRPAHDDYYRGGRGGYDDRRGGWDDRRDDFRRGPPPPRWDDRRGGDDRYYDDRRDDRRGGGDDRGRFEERPRY